jgi:L-ribulokinase
MDEVLLGSGKRLKILSVTVWREIVSEWLVGKARQELIEAPHIYEASHQFLEAVDWVVFKMTGTYYATAAVPDVRCSGIKRKDIPHPFFKGV